MNLEEPAYSGRIADACHDVQRVSAGRDSHGPIIGERHVGRPMKPARELSIYFPAALDLPFGHRELDFAARMGWGELSEGFPSWPPRAIKD